jgi:hypothetical protein
VLGQLAVERLEFWALTDCHALTAYLSGRPDSNRRMSAWKADALPLGDARVCLDFNARAAGGQERLLRAPSNGSFKELAIPDRLSLIRFRLRLGIHPRLALRRARPDSDQNFLVSLPDHQ